MSEFSKKNSHDENIKVSIDKILGSNVVLKKGRKHVKDRNKELFYEIIDNLIGLDIRERELNLAFMLDLEKYNTPFYTVIDSLFSLYFSKTQVNLIKFYLYGRINADGYLVELQNADGDIMNF